MEIGRSMIKLSDTPKSILRNSFSNDGGDERAVRIANTSGLSRHRVGVSPVRVRRSINDGVPTAVVTPSPPICISTRTISGLPHTISTKSNIVESSQSRYGGLSGLQAGNGNDFVVGSSIGTSVFGSGSALARRSHSSVGTNGLGSLPRKLDYQEFDEAKPLQHQQERFERAPWTVGGGDTECPVPSNSILTLHSLLDETQNCFRQPRDDSQERRLKELETRLREIEMRMINGIAMRRSIVSENAISGGANGSPKVDSPEVTSPAPSVPLRRTSTPNSHSVTKAPGSIGVLSVAVPPMMTFDSGIYRVQPTPRAEIKAQRDVERLEKKLKQQEEIAESLRAQHFKQIEQLTRQLAANDDVTQTLRSRIRELEVENELWQNRFRLYNDVDVAKILRENERLRARQRRRSSRGEEEEKIELLRKKELAEEENQKLRDRCNELEQKYRVAKDKYKEAVKGFRARHRQDHIEVESLKVTCELQNAELTELKRVIDQYGIASVEPPSTVVNNSPLSNAIVDDEFVKYNLEKCKGIAECLSKVCTRLKRRESLDPEDVLDYGVTAGSKNPGAEAPNNDKPFEEQVEILANKMTTLHSQVVDLYGDDLASSVSCNIQ